MGLDQQNPIPWQRKELISFLWVKYFVMHYRFSFFFSKAFNLYFIYSDNIMKIFPNTIWLKLCILNNAIVFINDK